MREKTSTTAPKHALRSVLALSDFRRLFAGVATSQLGDQFALIATPWLVLHLTGDPLALGLVLALEGGPRALFMLVGGVVTDRFSPRMVMFAADIARLVLAALLALAILGGAVEMWMVYAFALGFGLIAGFAVPAGNSIVPLVVGKGALETGNAVVMGGGQLVGFFGPFAAGVLIGTYSDGLTGVGLAFAVDAATFGVSAVMLGLMHGGGTMALSCQAADSEPLLAAVTRGLAFVWRNDAMRVTFEIIAAVNFLFVGPIMVGIPVLAEQRLPEGALAFGLLMSGFAGGNLCGYLLAGTAPKPGNRTLRLILVAVLAGFAAVLAVMGAAASTWLDFALLTALGVGNGYITIVLITSIQARAPREMLGRIMGLFMFAGFGLVPISQAISGVVSRWDVTLLFAGAAVMTAGVTVWAAAQPVLTSIRADIAPDAS